MKSECISSGTGIIDIEGRVVDQNVDTVTVNGVAATIEGEIFKAEDVALSSGENFITVISTDKAGNQTIETFTLYFDPTAKITYQYDKNDNLIQKCDKGITWNYLWDVENRLIKVSHRDTEGSERTVEYGYFDNGNRAWKKTAISGQQSAISYYVHDGVHVIAEYNGEGELLKEYVYSNNIDEVLQAVSYQPSAVSYYHQDGLNSVVSVTDSTGNQVASYNYEAFGSIKSPLPTVGEGQGEGENFSNPITYTGRWLELETGDYFYRERYYDAKSGRFLKKDPIGFRSRDYNFYRYVGNDATFWVDPFGLEEYKIRLTSTRNWFAGNIIINYEKRCENGVAHLDYDVIWGDTEINIVTPRFIFITNNEGSFHDVKRSKPCPNGGIGEIATFSFKISLKVYYSVYVNIPIGGPNDGIWGSYTDHETPIERLTGEGEIEICCCK